MIREEFVNYIESLGFKLKYAYDYYYIRGSYGIILYDNSYIDVNISKKLSNKYGFHWETRNEFNNIYRYDNYPDNDWKEIETFPFHFHNGYQENVVSAPFSTEIISAFREFMDFVKKLLKIT